MLQRGWSAIFWPDFGRLGPERPIWQICEVPYRDEPEFETGQVVVDKRRQRISLASEGSNLEGSRSDYKSYMSSQKDGGFHPFAAALKNLR